MSGTIDLPSNMMVFERGWLSANSIVFRGDGPTALVDSGYCTHADQTLRLVDLALDGRPLDLLLNTHLHSDHCGGNAALQARYSGLRTTIPPGLADHVSHWDPVALSYVPTGQCCPRFSMDGILVPGSEVILGDLSWQVHAAPGHDVHSVVLFEPQSRTLISADALWEYGFEVVFKELEGEEAFAEVEATLDLIESLSPAIVIPGHGKVFAGVAQPLVVARRRLDAFVKNPKKHAGYAAKVLLKFKLLDLLQTSLDDITQWSATASYFGLVHQRYFAAEPINAWLITLLSELEASGALEIRGQMLINR